MFYLVFLVIGFLLSLYSLLVSINFERDKNYVAFCDFRSGISCTKAFSSRFGALFGFKNSVLGLFFYVVLFIFYFFNDFFSSLMLLVFVNLFDLFLAYILFFKIRTICVVCICIYVVNVFFFYY
ncbi:hypothetical protein K9L67_02625 [Candidatus Woesearchaeota archaeon]|nr:hypothetical protein [Candidatus Woesearchaeota archaeon]MCF7901100.1 hypothetical protein [Candidatus Woesearchaeota archaeon]MCF8013433.1 hypothetical protein [Candidatus Woesearchaeota archaeon]